VYNKNKEIGEYESGEYKGSFDQNSYNNLSLFVDSVKVYEILKEMYGIDLDVETYQESMGKSPDDKLLAQQFSYIHSQKKS